MKNSPRNLKKSKDILNSDLRYFKRSHGYKTGLMCDSSDITSWSSNASMHYWKFSAEALVLKVLKGLGESKGSSVVAIKKYIINHYPHVDGKFTLPVIRRILRKSLINGKVVQSQGTTMDGRFKISAEEIRACQQKEHFRQAKACVRLREQQRMELEKRVQDSRAKEEQKRRFLRDVHTAKIKRQKENENAVKATKAKLTEKAARAILGLVKQHPSAAAALITPQNLRLSAGISKSFVPKPQIVDYADAAIETAKVVSSEQMKKAIIKAAEYTPNLRPCDKNKSTPTTHRSMPIKYERTIRNPTWDSFYPSYQTSLFNNYTQTSFTPDGAKLTEFFRNQKPTAKTNANSLLSSKQPGLVENGTRKKSVPIAKNVRKVTKRPKPNATTNAAFKITKALR